MNFGKREGEDMCEREKWAVLFQLSDCFFNGMFTWTQAYLIVGSLLGFTNTATGSTVSSIIYSLSLCICYNLRVSFCTLCFSVFIFVSLIAVLVSFLLVWFGFCWKAMRNVVFSAVLSTENPSGKIMQINGCRLSWIKCWISFYPMDRYYELL